MFKKCVLEEKGSVWTSFETETAKTQLLFPGPRGQNEKCLYYHGMAELIRWVPPPKTFLFGEIGPRC